MQIAFNLLRRFSDICAPAPGKRHGLELSADNKLYLVVRRQLQYEVTLNNMQDAAEPLAEAVAEQIFKQEQLTPNISIAVVEPTPQPQLFANDTPVSANVQPAPISTSIPAPGTIPEGAVEDVFG
jgi:hypothetical protein